MFSRAQSTIVHPIPYTGPSPWRFGSVIFLGFFLKLLGILFVFFGFNIITPELRLVGFVLIPLGIFIFTGGILWGAMEGWKYRATIMTIHAWDPLATTGMFLHGGNTSSVTVVEDSREGVHSASPVEPNSPLVGLQPVNFTKQGAIQLYAT
ncbi:uncharacterized protein LOC135391966 [Ornithodoros turicata]